MELGLAEQDSGARGVCTVPTPLASIEDTLRSGSRAIGVAAVALQAAGLLVREIKTNVLRCSGGHADLTAARDAIAGLQTKLRDCAVAAVSDGVNLLTIAADAKANDLFVVSALARDVTGAMKATSITVDRDAIALFDARSSMPGPRGILDRVDPRSGVSIATLDVSTLTPPRDPMGLVQALGQVDKAIAAIAAAGSTLSLARSRIELQACFIHSFADEARADEPGAGLSASSEDRREPILAVDLDQASVKRKAIETRTLMAGNRLSIANLNTRMILKLFEAQ